MDSVEVIGIEPREVSRIGGFQCICLLHGLTLHWYEGYGFGPERRGRCEVRASPLGLARVRGRAGSVARFEDLASVAPAAYAIAVGVAYRTLSIIGFKGSVPDVVGEPAEM